MRSSAERERELAPVCEIILEAKRKEELTVRKYRLGTKPPFSEKIAPESTLDPAREEESAYAASEDLRLPPQLLLVSTCQQNLSSESTTAVQLRTNRIIILDQGIETLALVTLLPWQAFPPYRHKPRFDHCQLGQGLILIQSTRFLERFSRGSRAAALSKLTVPHPKLKCYLSASLGFQETGFAL
jgi:hypothetical protein